MEHIFILNINQLKDGDTFRYYFNEMSRERQNKIMQFKMEADRLRSLGAGIALHAILKQYGLNPRETCLEYGTNGKASVAGRPDIHFNLTHSGCYAAGVCGAAPVGIDIEEIGLMKVKVARRFFHDGEYRYLEQMEDGQRKQEAFFRPSCCFPLKTAGWPCAAPEGLSQDGSRCGSVWTHPGAQLAGMNF